MCDEVATQGATPSWSRFNAMQVKRESGRVDAVHGSGGLVPRLTERQQMALLNIAGDGCDGGIGGSGGMLGAE